MGKCSICGAKAIIKIPYARLKLCRKHFIEFYERRVEGVLRRYGLVREGMKLVIAVSGGKDSVALAHALWRLRSKLGIKVVGLHINLGIGVFSELAEVTVKEFSKQVGMPVAIVNIKDVLGVGVPELAKLSRRPPCSICGLIRRYFMNAFAIGVGADALATGHNMDDIMANIMKEFLNQNIEAMLKLTPGTPSVNSLAVSRIRPLYEVGERENLVYALINDLPFLKVTCPHMDVRGMDRIIKNYLIDLDLKFPGLRISFMRKYVKNVSKYVEAPQQGLRRCRYCGLISSGDVCSFCKLTEKVLGYPAGPKVREYIESRFKWVRKLLTE